MPDSSPNAQQRLLQELVLLFDPVVRAAQDPDQAYALLRTTGWTPEALLGASGAAFLDALTQTAGAIQVVQQSLATPPESLADFEVALTRVAGAVDKLQALPGALGSGQPAALQQLPGDLLEVLGLMYLQHRAAALLPILRALTIIHPDTRTPITNSSGLVRLGGTRERLDLARLPALLADPLGQLRNFYLPNGLGTTADAVAAAIVLLPNLAGVFAALGADTVVGRGNSVGSILPSVAAAMARTLTVAWQMPVESDDEGTRLELGFALRLIAADENATAGVLLAPFGQAALLIALSDAWRLTLGASATVNAALITRAGVQMPALPGGPAQLGLNAAVEKFGRDGDPALRVGSVNGTRLEVGRLRLTATGTFDAQARGYGVLLEATSGALIVAPGDADGFLQQILPSGGLRTDIDLALGWANDRGLYFRGGANLDTTLPVHRDLAGLLKIETISLAVRADGGGLRALVGAAVSVQLGPVNVSVAGVGVQAFVTFPPGGGNVGLADLQLRFNPPTGAGLSVDAGVVVGGGFLLFDEAKQQYTGAIQLELAKRIQLSAFGLLSTRMPDGSPGFSLLILMSARFSPPVQLGYGFTLNGVGGLVGVNRTVAVEALRSGLRTGALGSVLFPQDPIRNAPQIVSDLQAIFPPARGRFLFGPMAQLGWGTPTLLTIDLGLVLELPAPVRLLILGRLRVLLPDQRAPVVRLQLDAIGLIDFASGDVALDAVLYDSQVAQFAVTGAMALRANFGSNPNFVLAIGGFNPRFVVPAGFPALERVAISLATGDNPRLRLEAYFALTTNTVQFGAHLEVFAKAGPFSIEGLLGFDVLMQLQPFGFIADLGAAVALKYNGKSVLSVALQMTLTGPTPWHAWGEASYKVLFFSGSIHFDVRLGAADVPPLPPPVDVRPLLLAAFRDADNWTIQMPRNERPIVSLRDRPGDPERLVHPVADLRVKQQVAPLGREISRFGGATPERERIFNLGVVGTDGTVRSTPAEGVDVITDLFAPGQFRDMTDDEKLTAPAFEPMQAGVRFATPGYTCGPSVVERDIKFARKTLHRVAAPATLMGDQTGLIAAPATAVPGPDVTMAADFVQRVASSGAAGQAPIARTGTDRFAARATGISLREPRFVVVIGHGLAAALVPTIPPPPPKTGPVLPGPMRLPVPLPTVSTLPGYAAALETLARQGTTAPSDRGRLRVIPDYSGVSV